MEKLSLDRPVVYCIKVPGELDEHWLDCAADISLSSDGGEGVYMVTTLTGTFDQAGLIGFLRRLYGMGLPLISVVWVEG